MDEQVPGKLLRDSDGSLSQEAVDALKRGNLAAAEALLKKLTRAEERQVDSTAPNHFNLAAVHELRLQFALASPEYEMAYRYRPEEFAYHGGTAASA